MGFWGVVKKAINSTVGTQDFVPLNEYMDGMIQVVPSYNERIYLEENKWLTLADSNSSLSLRSHKTKAYKFNANGNVRLTGSLYSDSPYFTVYVIKQRNTSQEEVLYQNLGGNANVAFDPTFGVTKGDTIYVRVTNDSSLQNNISNLFLTLCFDTILAPHGGVAEVVANA